MDKKLEIWVKVRDERNEGSLSEVSGSVDWQVRRIHESITSNEVQTLTGQQFSTWICSQANSHTHGGQSTDVMVVLVLIKELRGIKGWVRLCKIRQRVLAHRWKRPSSRSRQGHQLHLTQHSEAQYKMRHHKHDFKTQVKTHYSRIYFKIRK